MQQSIVVMNIYDVLQLMVFLIICNTGVFHSDCGLGQL